MLLKTEQLLARDGVPDLTCPVVAASDEPARIKRCVLLIARLIEGAISKRQEMSTENLEALEFLVLIFHLLFDEL